MGTSISSTRTHQRLSQLRKQKTYPQRRQQKILQNQKHTPQVDEKKAKHVRNMITVQNNPEQEKKQTQYIKTDQNKEIKLKTQHKVDQMTGRHKQQTLLKQSNNQREAFVRQIIHKEESNLVVMRKSSQLKFSQMVIQMPEQQSIPSYAHLKTLTPQINRETPILPGEQKHRQRFQRLEKPQNQLFVYKNNNNSIQMKQQNFNDMKKIQEAKDYINNSNFLQPHNNQKLCLPTSYHRSRQNRIEDFHYNKSTDLIKKPYDANNVQDKQDGEAFVIQLKTDEESIQRPNHNVRNNHTNNRSIYTPGQYTYDRSVAQTLSPNIRNDCTHRKDIYVPGQFTYDSSKIKLDNSIYMLSKAKQNRANTSHKTYY